MIKIPLGCIVHVVYFVCNNGGTRTLVDSDILNKKDVLLPPKKYALIENKTVYLI